MKVMKILSLVVILCGFSKCRSTKFDQKPPFIITSSSYTSWVGGVPGVSGTRVDITLSEKTTIRFDSLFFKKKITKIEVSQANEKTVLTAHYNTSKKQKTDFILHADSKKELKNEIPTITAFPFDLKENDAVISYQVNGKTKYYKLENIQKVTSGSFPKIQ